MLFIYIYIDKTEKNHLFFHSQGLKLTLIYNLTVNSFGGKGKKNLRSN